MGMDLLLSWVTGAVAYVVTVLAGTAFALLVTTQAMLTDGGRLVWTGTTAFAAYGLAALAASLVHREDKRDGRGERVRHAVAVLAVPSLAALSTLVAALARGTPVMPLVLELVAGPVAAVLAWRGMILLRARRERHSASATDAALRY